jgi:hypothetical protein
MEQDNCVKCAGLVGFVLSYNRYRKDCSTLHLYVAKPPSTLSCWSIERHQMMLNVSVTTI